MSSLGRTFTRFARRFARRLGVDIRRSGGGWDSRNLATYCDPTTVVDVGVGFGTPELYRAFPEAALCLIEPIKEYRDHLSQWPNARVVVAAAGSRAGRTVINIDPELPTRSSIARRSKLTETGSKLIEREVEVITLDSLVDQLEGPFLLKIDTEGHEAEVIRGASAFLDHTEVVIAEVSIARRFENGYSFEDFLQLMLRNGFAVIDILHVSYLPSSGRVSYADVVFGRNQTRESTNTG